MSVPITEQPAYIQMTEAFYKNMSTEANRAAMKIDRCQRLIKMREFGFKEQKIAEFYSCHPHFLTDAYDTLKGICTYDETWSKKDEESEESEKLLVKSFHREINPCKGKKIWMELAQTLIRTKANEMYSDDTFPDIADNLTSVSRDELFRRSVKEDRKIEDIDFEIVKKFGTEKENAEIVPALYRFWYDEALPKPLVKFLKRVKLDEDSMSEQFPLQTSEEMSFAYKSDDAKVMDRYSSSHIYENAKKLTEKSSFALSLYAFLGKLIPKEKEGEMWRFMMADKEDRPLGGIDRDRGENTSSVVSENGFGKRISWSPINRIAAQFKAIANPLAHATGDVTSLYDNYQPDNLRLGVDDDHPTKRIEHISMMLYGYPYVKEIGD